MSISKLRNPTPAERKAGLPKTKKEAIKQGINRFIPADGEERTIRNYGSNSYPNGQVQLSLSRKTNRGGSYSGSSGTREFNKHLASPAGSDFEAANQAIQEANTAGMDGDHTQDLARTAEGKRFKVQSGRGTVEEYDARFAKANVPIGHTKENIKPLPAKVNQKIKPAELRAMDNGIANADGGKYVFEQLQRSVGYSKGENVIASAKLTKGKSPFTKAGKVGAVLTAVAFADAIGRGASANELGGMAIDSVNPIDGGAVADGTLEGQKFQEMMAKPKEYFPTTQKNGTH